jgi:hypothetical protein
MSVACDFSPNLMDHLSRRCKFRAVEASLIAIEAPFSSCRTPRFGEGEAVERIREPCGSRAIAASGGAKSGRLRHARPIDRSKGS